MGVIKYNKLVRDKIPEIIERGGKKAVFEVLERDTYKKYLDKKLAEELQEYFAGDDVAELADIVEVIYAILAFKGIDLKDFENIRKSKAEERGVFARRILLKEIVDE